MDKPRETKKTSRRTFLNRSIATAVAVGAAGTLGSRAAAQAPRAPRSGPQPVVDLAGEKVVQISMVVKDVQKVAKRFSEVWGASWKLYDLKPTEVILHDKELPDGSCSLKLAIGNLGGRSFKLVQPVSGQSSYMEFLQKQGEGFYSFSVGTLANHDKAVADLKKAGVVIEMQGGLGNDAKFTVLETVDDLGVRVELASASMKAGETNLKPAGSIVATGHSVINMERPINSGGKRFTQLGIIVKDDKRAAARFEELFGIRGSGWRFYPIPVLADYDTYVNEKLVAKADIPSLNVDCASAVLGDIQLELLRPIGMKPGGCHQAFFDKHGPGFQHLNLGPRSSDYHITMDALKKAGFHPEFVCPRGEDGSSEVTYVAMEEQLGGMVLEFGGKKVED